MRLHKTHSQEYFSLQYSSFSFTLSFLLFSFYLSSSFLFLFSFCLSLPTFLFLSHLSLARSLAFPSKNPNFAFLVHADSVILSTWSCLEPGKKRSEKATLGKSQVKGESSHFASPWWGHFLKIRIGVAVKEELESWRERGTNRDGNRDRNALSKSAWQGMLVYLFFFSSDLHSALVPNRCQTALIFEEQR